MGFFRRVVQYLVDKPDYLLVACQHATSDDHGEDVIYITMQDQPLCGCSFRLVPCIMGVELLRVFQSTLRTL